NGALAETRPRRKTGYEDEDFGSIAEPVVADREPGQEIRRHVVDENQPQRQAAKQIEPQFPLTAREDERLCRDGRRQGGAVRDRFRLALGGGSGDPISDRYQSGVLKPSRHLIPAPCATASNCRTWCISMINLHRTGHQFSWGAWARISEAP